MLNKVKKIGFDVSDLATARADGTTRYCYELAKRLPNLSPGIEWVYFSPGDFKQNFEFQKENYKTAISPWPKYWTQLRLPADIYRYRPDILFMPIQQLPYFRPGKMETVAVIHDLAFHEYGDQFTRKDWMLLHAFTANVAETADRIIAVSQATANDIEKYYGRSEDVRVVHHGVNEDQFRSLTGKEKAESLLRIKDQHPQITKSYILFVGQIQPRKNIVGLIEAFELIKESGADLQLVIAGGHGWLNEPILRKARESEFAESIIVTGRVKDELLPGLYANAEVYVLPSFYEGFGMPILEAMACGCPVVTSNISSMPEVAGEAAVLVDPNNYDDIAKGILEALTRKENLVERGRKRVQDFSWDKCAEKTMKMILG